MLLIFLSFQKYLNWNNDSILDVSILLLVIIVVYYWSNILYHNENKKWINPFFIPWTILLIDYFIYYIKIL